MPRHKPRFGPGEFIILFAIGLLSLIIVTGNFTRIAQWLFSPTAIIIVVVILLQYLLLKGADRSDIYRRELEAARQKRRDDLLALRELEARLSAMRANLEDVLQQPATQPDQLREALAAACETSRQLHTALRDRV